MHECAVQLGRIMDNKIPKKQNPNCCFWRAGSKTRIQCMPPALNTTKGVDKPAKPSSRLIFGLTPTLTPREESPGLPSGVIEQATEHVTYPLQQGLQ